MSSYIDLLYLLYSPKCRSILKVAIKLDVNTLVGGWDTIDFWAEYSGILLAELPSYYRENYGELILIDLDKINDIIIKEAESSDT